MRVISPSVLPPESLTDGSLFTCTTNSEVYPQVSPTSKFLGLGRGGSKSPRPQEIHVSQLNGTGALRLRCAYSVRTSSPCKSRLLPSTYLSVMMSEQVDRSRQREP